MAKGRYGGPRQKKGGGAGGSRVGSDEVTSTSTGPIFVRVDGVASTARFTSPLLLTLLFHGKADQHRALARIEAFYESTCSDSERHFLTLSKASQLRLCPNYEAFNCPVAIVREWLECMRQAHNVAPALVVNDKTGDAAGVQDRSAPSDQWWKPYCNDEEVELLGYLAGLGCLENDLDNNPQPTSSSPLYIITALASQANSSLPHERLHFLYFASPAYRELAQQQFASLSTKARKVVETDLHMRGYATHVYVDEFQAYVSLDSAEFGKHISDECASLQPPLLRAQRDLWISLAAHPARAVDDEAVTFI